MENMKQEYVARVRNGRLSLDEPTELPEGTEVELEMADPDGVADAVDRAKLRDALLRSEQDSAAGRIVDASDVMAKLGQRR